MNLEQIYRAHANPVRAQGMSAYMRNLFPFVGLDTKQRRQLSKPFLQPEPPEQLRASLEHLWSLPEREFQYFGVELAYASRRLWQPEVLQDVAQCILRKPWWDTVDGLASNVVGGLVAQFPELVSSVDRWLDHESFWLRRASLLHQLSYKQKTDRERLFQACRRLADQCGHTRDRDELFFLRKAIGWALRQYARTDAQAVRDFVESMGDRLSGLSRREALKHISA